MYNVVPITRPYIYIYCDVHAQTLIAQELEIKFSHVGERSTLRRSIWSSYVYRVFRLIDSELHVTRLKTRYLWNSSNVWRWAFIDLPSQARNAPICAPGKKRERARSLSPFLFVFLPPESQGKRAIPAKFAQEGRLIYGGSSSSPLSYAEFREAAAARPFLDPFSLARPRVSFSSPTGRKPYLLFSHP